MDVSRRQRRWFNLGLWLGLIALGACSPSPQARYEEAVEAAQAKDLAAYSAFFGRKGGQFLRDIVAARAATQWVYLRDPYALLPQGAVERVTEEGEVVYLTVGQGPRAQEIRMFNEDGEWVIDFYALGGLWEPLEGAR